MNRGTDYIGGICVEQKALKTCVQLLVLTLTSWLSPQVDELSLSLHPHLSKQSKNVSAVSTLWRCYIKWSKIYRWTWFTSVQIEVRPLYYKESKNCSVSQPTSLLYRWERCSPKRRFKNLAFCLLLYPDDDILTKVHDALTRDGRSSLGYFIGWTTSFSQMGYTSEADLNIRSILTCLSLSSEYIWGCWAELPRIWEI